MKTENTHINMNSTSPSLESSRIDDNNLNSESSIFVTAKELTEQSDFEAIDLKVEKEDIMNKDFYCGNPISNRTPRRIGNTWAFLYNKDNEPLIVIGPHWPFYICLTSTISLISFLFFTAMQLSLFVRILGIISFLVQFLSYTYTFLINPGLPKKSVSMAYSDKLQKKAKEGKGYKFCNQCHFLMNLDENTNHCDDCNVCVEGNHNI
jgi:hypothetical protein